MSRFSLPYVWRPVRGPIEVKMPYDPADPGANRRWLNTYLGPRIQLTVTSGRWTVSRAHLRRVVTGVADRCGAVNVYLDYREHQKCDTRCRDAAGDDCVCSCAGLNHGGADYMRTWIEVADTTLVSTGEPLRRRHTVVHPG